MLSTVPSFTRSSKVRPARVLLALAIAIVGLAAFPSCRCSSTPEPRTLASEFQVGTAPFRSSSYREVRALTIHKADPQSGDSWTAELKNTDPQAAIWEFITAPIGVGSFDPKDRRADHRFIQHLLDTAMTLRVVEGIEENDRSRIGLSPPAYALRWQTPQMEYELKVGSGRTSGHRYAELSVQSLQPPGPKKESGPVVVQGATLQMLELMKNFETIRSRILFNFDPDDVDEIEVTSKRVRAAFYMQRHGDGWADRAKRPLRHSPEGWFNDLMHLRVFRFLDDPREIAEARTQIEKDPTFEILLKDREGHPTQLKARFIQKNLIAILSSRPEGAFQLFAETFRLIQTPGKTAHDAPAAGKPSRASKTERR